ncbi:Mut7-C RNAse domain-containing protein [Amycolatopsis taiwanensis]|uniref:Twitching motility protein PilT n=1 Tax=Amycolatopsis taiwanensis TaxID=342230 RepID=A0A9W6QZE5_9PSEU|nr:Mut7-C RNAse domain-containing protein [Amycolatopsis taiwanensis]GLY66513.1 hypothetical protein Atai01_31320 [Amycolatopsis taiwanensis]
MESALEIRVAAELRLFVTARRRAARGRHPRTPAGGNSLLVPYDGTSTVGHVVESAGIPLTEVGGIVAGGRAREAAYRPREGDVIEVAAVSRPEALYSPRFTLDVHLGALARRLRLVGVDAAYANDIDDDALIDHANAEHRVLLTQDRQLLHRRALWRGAYVRGALPEDQLRDVLDRFAPPLAPWTRCTACNGMLTRVPKGDVEHDLEPGTRRRYQDFSRCTACGRLYWRGAHSGRIHAIVDTAMRAVAARSR